MAKQWNGNSVKLVRFAKKIGVGVAGGPGGLPLVRALKT